MARVLNFHHTGLLVPSEHLNKALDFYTKVMGYTARHQAYERDCNYIDMELSDGSWFEIIDHAETMPDSSASDDAVLEHTAYEVDDIYGFIARAKTYGATVVFGPIEAKFCNSQKILVAYIQGICGEAIEITQNI